jgi:excisionase family DNA binding protein
MAAGVQRSGGVEDRAGWYSAPMPTCAVTNHLSTEGSTMALLTIDDAAQRLGTSTRFIRRLVSERRIAFTRLGRHIRIDSADIDAFIQAGRVEPRVPSTS